MPACSHKQRTQNVLNEAGPDAARYLRDVMRSKKAKIEVSRDRIQSARFIVDHAVGTPTQKKEVTGKDGGPIQIKTVIIVRPELPAGTQVEEIPGQEPALLTYPDTLEDNNKDNASIEPNSGSHNVNSATFEPDNTHDLSDIEQAINQLKAITHNHNQPETAQDSPKIPTQE